jgi:hypothetical protein
MSARNPLEAIAVFGVVTLLIVGGAAVAPFAVGGDGPTPEVTNLAKQQTNVDAYTVPPAEETGEIRMDSDAESKTILVDRAHQNRFSDEELASLTNALSANGHEVRFLTRESARGPAFNETLRQADAYLVVNPMQPHTSQQLAGVEAFEEAGGRVVMLTDPASVQAGGLFGLVVQEVSSKYAGLGSTFGASVSPGYLYNMHEYQHNYKSIYATPEASSSLSEGVDRVVFREASAVSIRGGDAALTGVEQTKLSSTRKAKGYTVAAQAGDVAIVGDTDFLATDDAYLADNEVLVGNLADFLVSGDKRPGAPASPQPTRPGGAPGGAPPPDGAPPTGDAPSTATATESSG